MLCRLVAVICVLVCLATASWPPGTSGGFSDVSSDVDLGSNAPFRVAALADWDNDKNVDLVGISNDNSTFVVYLWASGNNSFYPNLHVPLNGTLVSVVVADMNRDGLLDAIVHRGDRCPCLIYGHGALECEDSFDGLIPSPGPSITVHDIQSSCANLEIVMTLNDADNSMVILRRVEPTDGFDCNYIGDTPRWTRHFTKNMVPNTGSGVDLDGNCVADFITASTTKSHTISYVAEEAKDDGSMKETTSWSVPEHVGAPAWIDIDGDGITDVAYPSCTEPRLDNVTKSYTCDNRFDAILFIKNDVGGSDACDGNNCCGGHSVKFASVDNVFDTPADKKWRHWKLTDGDGDCDSHVYLLDDVKFPALLRPLDVNRNRFMDMVASTSAGPMVFHNNNGGYSFTCKLLDSAKSSSDATFRESIPFFFDLNEDGRVDIMTTSRTANGVWAYWNGVEMIDKYFLTATTLNGVKGGDTPYPSWGAVQVGATHRFRWQDIDLTTRFASNTQFANSNNHALQMPHVHFGLARTFSYVQDYATGMYIKKHKNYNTWPVYLIPNSQVVCFAYPLTDAEKWQIRLFLPTSRFKKLILYSLITALGLIGIPILYLRFREIQEDKKELMSMIN